MAKPMDSSADARRLTDLVRDLIIVQLGLAGIGQREIRSIVGGDINRINRIVRHLRTRSRKALKKGD